LVSIEQLQSWAKSQLTDSESAAVDVRLLLCHCLQCEPVYLLTWPDKTVSEQQSAQFKQLVAQRKLGHPIAYLLGYRDFWSLRLKVSNATLIPRPETELLIETSLSLELPEQAIVLDLGTGTGAIALALASEKPQWQVMGIDKSPGAISLAKENALLNNIANINFQQSDWYSAIAAQKFDLIVSNPPYVEDDSHYLTEGDVRFEPLSALISGPDGLDDIRKIISESRHYLQPLGWLLLEHGYLQGPNIQLLLQQAGYSEINTLKDLNHLPRITIAQYLREFEI
jgi:release factor glutamine methyltransferase